MITAPPVIITAWAVKIIDPPVIITAVPVIITARAVIITGAAVIALGSLSPPDSRQGADSARPAEIRPLVNL
jgi:hypothetical protein